MEIKVTKISSGEKANELAERIIDLTNEYSGILTGYEMIGVLDTVKKAAHKSIDEIEDEDSL